MKELPQGKKESFCKRLLEYALIHRQTGRGPGRAAAQKQGNGSFPLIGDVGPSGGPSPSCVRARARALPGACVCSGNAPQARATLPTLPPSCDGRDSVRRPAGPSGGGRGAPPRFTAAGAASISASERSRPALLRASGVRSEAVECGRSISGARNAFRYWHAGRRWSPDPGPAARRIPPGVLCMMKDTELEKLSTNLRPKNCKQFYSFSSSVSFITSR